MPNHVTSRITVTGPADDIQGFRDLMIVEDDGALTFDCGRIIPMPECLVGTTSGGHTEEGAALIIARATQKHSFGLGPDDLGLGHAQIDRIRSDVGMPTAHLFEVAAAYLKLKPEVEAEGMKMLKAIAETGYASWYPWSIDKWGTKWGCYSFREHEAEKGAYAFEFQSAWSFPEPVFIALAERFPTLTFDCLAFDEGWNFACIGEFGGDLRRPFKSVRATSELYEAVYGHAPDREDEDA